MLTRSCKRTRWNGWFAAGVATVFLASAPACRRDRSSSAVEPDPGGASEGHGSQGAPPAVPFEVRADSNDVAFFWFDEHGAPHPAATVAEIPAANRSSVRVDPARPELRAPGWVYVADVRTPGPDGRFPVRVVSSEEFANGLSMLNGLAQAMAAPAAPEPNRHAGLGPPPDLTAQAAGQRPAGDRNARVVIYGASWCSACHQAAQYLRANNIPFVEHDIEQEPAAAQEMYARAREQHVPTGSIPIIDIGGRLMVGFNPYAIQQALSGS